MDIKVPSVGESVYEATIAKWHKKDGEQVEKNDLLCELETDKITLELNADAAGALSIGVPEGETVEIGQVIGGIDEEAVGRKEKEDATIKKEKPPADREAQTEEQEKEKKAGEKKEEKAAKPAPEKEAKAETVEGAAGEKPRQEEPAREAPAAEPRPAEAPGRTRREPMSRLRRRIAERLVAARQQTAMLTTFNEADLTRVLALRKKHGETFAKRHGVRLGFMSFFVKACAEALKEFPEVNAGIDGDDIVYHQDQHIGIAIGSGKGLVVPVLRRAGDMDFAAVEKAVRGFAEKVENNRLDLSDLEGGTFTITNGGVYGSLLSTPILNPPQSAILGMHAIQERPVVRAGEIVIRPMMYLALSYDHRLIDGREAVSFLRRVMEFVEEPDEMLLEL